MAATCPICDKETAAQYRPFCSKRCADIDLAHWLRGDYRIPSEADESLSQSDDET